MGGSNCHQSLNKESQVNTIVISNGQQNRSQKEEESFDLKGSRNGERIPTLGIEIYNSGTTMSMTKYCVICKKSIGSDLYEALCCKQTECHSYHTKCFEKSLMDQINKGKHLLKFKCGTVIKTKLLRDSGLENKMNLLGKLFELQIDHCLKDSRIRKDEQLMKYYQQNRPSKEASDYFLINQDLLEYQETPQ